MASDFEKRNRPLEKYLEQIYLELYVDIIPSKVGQHFFARVVRLEHVVGWIADDDMEAAPLHDLSKFGFPIESSLPGDGFVRDEGVSAAQIFSEVREEVQRA